MEGYRCRQLAVVASNVRVYANLADIVRCDGYAPRVAVETVAGTHIDVGEYLDATGNDKGLESGAGLRDQERRQDFPRNVVLRAVFMYIDHWKAFSPVRR